ncbi:hypothetical protein M5G07_08375 [Serratia symbiotica]|nr:hypothetical protein [Serratia symbiotica]
MALCQPALAIERITTTLKGMYTHADIIIALTGKNPRLRLYAVVGAMHVVAAQGETNIQGHIAAFAKISLKEK